MTAVTGVVRRKTKMKNYNEEVLNLANEANGYYRKLNKFVMDHTYELCKIDSNLLESIRNTNDNSYMVEENDAINVQKDNGTSNIIISKF